MISEGRTGSETVFMLKEGVSTFCNMQRIATTNQTQVLSKSSLVERFSSVRGCQVNRVAVVVGNMERKDTVCLVKTPTGLRLIRPFQVVELNLRLPSMLHGKQGFERIVWAFKNVLNQSVAWLFCDLAESTPSQKEGMTLP